MEIRFGFAGNDRARFLVHCLSTVLETMTPRKAVASFCDSHKNLFRTSGRIHVIGFGKAAYGMYAGIAESLPESPVHASVIVPENEPIRNKFAELQILHGEHPFPGHGSLSSSEIILKGLAGLGNGDLVIALVSGGGSSLFEFPIQGLSIHRIASVTRCMMESGSDIRELNAARKLMSNVKGGKLNRMLYPARVVSLIISDVPGDDPALVASGPTVFAAPPGRKVLAAALDSIRRCDPGTEETVKSNLKMDIDHDAEPESHWHLVLKNGDLVEAMANELRKHGEKVVSFGSGFTGNVEDLSSRILLMLRGEFARFGAGFWFAMGGESTATVRGAGTGGRNQELAARLALKMLPGENCVFMSAGTDGMDGNSSAMGSVVFPGSLDSVPPEEVEKHLAESNLTPLLKRIGSALFSGPTGNNVSDIMAGYYGGLDGHKPINSGRR